MFPFIVAVAQVSDKFERARAIRFLSSIDRDKDIGLSLPPVVLCSARTDITRKYSTSQSSTRFDAVRWGRTRIASHASMLGHSYCGSFTTGDKHHWRLERWAV